MKIAVISNCQIVNLTRCMEYLVPGSAVTPLAVWSVSDKFHSEDQLLTWLSSYDRVFLFEFEHVALGDASSVSSALLIANLSNATLYPSVVFPAFHPDQVNVATRSGKNLASPLMSAHSALCLYGYLRGMDIKTTKELFCGETYEKAGYFNFWNDSVASLVAPDVARQYGLGQMLQKWTADGCFMHNIMHPKLRVSGDIALEALRQAGMESKNRLVSRYLQDDLIESVIWPVYDEIGEYYNILGEYTFQRHPRDHSGNWPLHLGLEQFIEISFQCYAEHNPSDLICGRVENWLRLDDIG